MMKKPVPHLGVAVFGFSGSDRGEATTMKAIIFCSKMENTERHGGRTIWTRLSRLQRYWPGPNGRLSWESSADLVLTRTGKRRTGISMIQRVMLLILIEVLIVRMMPWFLILRPNLLLLFMIMNSHELDPESDDFAWRIFLFFYFIWFTSLCTCFFSMYRI